MGVVQRSRYRSEDGKACIDIRLRTSRQLFDGRDPAPFRERDLDPGAVEHLLACAREIRRGRPIKIVLSFTEEDEPRLDPAVLRDAIHAQFEHERELVARRIRENFRRGQLLGAIGISVLGLFLTLAELTGRLPEGHVQKILREGFTITGWVAMWRPAETLLYEWWPLLDDRKRIQRILDAEIDVRYERGSIAP